MAFGFAAENQKVNSHFNLKQILDVEIYLCNIVMSLVINKNMFFSVVLIKLYFVLFLTFVGETEESLQELPLEFLFLVLRRLVQVAS